MKPDSSEYGVPLVAILIPPALYHFVSSPSTLGGALRLLPDPLSRAKGLIIGTIMCVPIHQMPTSPWSI